MTDWPPLRDDLDLVRGPMLDGLPTWTLHDPVSNRFFRLSWKETEILVHWSLGDAQAIAHSVSAVMGRVCAPGEVMAVAEFCHRMHLVDAVSPATLAHERATQRQGIWQWLLHHYLFLRIPLVRPNALLSAMLPWCGWMFSRWFWGGVGVLSLLGFWGIALRWEEYRAGLHGLLSMRGLVSVALALGAAKLVHEFGHGITARRMGCDVPAMGVAFLVLMPVFWTDTTDAWRLQDARGRVAIDAAGMLSELVLAAVASVLWAVLPDGGARQAALVLSGSVWISAVLLNLSPLMRFDGYYIASDLLGVPNLQSRGYALGRWQLRTWLFGHQAPPPEHMRRGRAIGVLCYAFASMVYRFFLFLGIAVLVYREVFKALGIVLFGIEIWFFLVGPILREIRQWGRLMQAASRWRRGVVLGVMVVGVLVAVVPWNRTVRVDGLWRPAMQARLRTAEAGALVWLLAPGTEVTRGQVVAHLVSEDLQAGRDVAQARLQTSLAELRRAGFAGESGDRAMLSTMADTQEEVSRGRHDVAAAEGRIDALDIRAPFDGVVVDVDPQAYQGEVFPKHTPLFSLLSQGPGVVVGYVGETDIRGIHAGTRGRFWSKTGGPPLCLTVERVSDANAEAIEELELAQPSGGHVAVHRDRHDTWQADLPLYRVVARVDAPAPAPAARIFGLMVLDAPSSSFALQVYRRAASLLVRESGF